MKKAILLSAFIATSLGAFAQIPNAGFESWTTTGSYSSPDSWGTLNAMTSSMSVYTAEKGTPGSPGSSYLKLTSKTVTGMGVMPGIAATGQINMATMSVKGGFPYTTRSANLTGSWQYMAMAGTDQGFISVYLTKWNSAMMMRDTVASAVKLLPGMAMSWANFTIPLTYTKNYSPDSALIIMSSSGMTPANNSYLYVDNLGFSGTVATTGVSNLNLNAEVHLYPNPASGSSLNVSYQKDKINISQISISDVTGRIWKLTDVKGNPGNISVDISALASGLYILTVNTPDGTAYRKFTKN